jgi:PKD domain-containing protein
VLEKQADCPFSLLKALVRSLEMHRSQYNLVALFLPLIVVAFGFFASEAAAQKARETFVYGPPTLSLTADQTVIRACEGDKSALVNLNAKATSPNGNTIHYRWTTSTGRITGDGPSVSWDLAGAQPGFHKAFLTIDSSTGDESCEVFSSVAVLVNCPPAPPVCPTVSISCPENVMADRAVTFTSTITGSLGNIVPSYNWTVSAGTIIEGQGTPTIKVDTAGLAGQSIKAGLSLGGYNLDCSANCSIEFPIPLTCRKFDEFAGLSRNDEKARLDNYFIDLQNDPTSTANVIVHPGEGGKSGAVQMQTSHIVDYLINSRGLDSRRIVTQVGTPRSAMTVELWSCPQGAAPPK